MPDQTRIPIGNIHPNPYQTRFEENAERIASIALSIAEDGLLQPPTVRKNGKGYELAFGHTRTSAWWLCNDIQLGNVGADAVSAELFKAVRNSKEDFSQMPVFIADIDDEKMFRHAVTENAQRADLSPVEEATAMKKAMDEFKYTSEQAGALFGKSGATVRGKVRLLDLPTKVRTKLHAGEISESAGRALVTLERMAPESMDDAVKDILDGDDAENVIDNVLRMSKHVKTIYSHNFPVEAKNFKHLPVLKEKEAAKLDPEKKEHLLNPPACTACQLYAKVDGSNYCGFIQCFERKAAAHDVTKLEAASKKTGIAIYQESDGARMLLKRWEDKHAKRVEKRDPDLRLMCAEPDGAFHYVLDIPSGIAVVAVGKLYEQYKKAEQQSQIASEAYDKIQFEVFAPFFFPLLDGVKNEEALQSLAYHISVENELFDQHNKQKLSGGARLKHLRAAILSEMIERETSWDDRRKFRDAKNPAADFAKHIRKLAEKYGLKLGKDFDQAVTDADTKINAMRQAAIDEALKGIVSTETKKGKSK